MQRTILYLTATCWISSGALAHSWFDSECCSGQDCSEIVSILEVADGDLVTTIDGRAAIFPKSFPRYKSLDNYSYACIGQGGTPRCLYIPDISS